MPVPAHVPDDLVVGVDHVGGEEYLADPFGFFDRLGKRGPIHYSSELGGFWLITDAELIREAIAEPSLFSNRQATIPPYPGPPMVPTQLDPPEHGKYRKLIISSLSPRAVEEKVPMMQRRTRQLLDAIEPGSTVDFVEVFARPLPALVFTSLCDVPEEMADKFAEWVHGLSDISPETSAHCVYELRAYMNQLITERRGSDGDDLLSTIARAQIDGEPISAQMAENMAFVLTRGGLNTTTAFMSLAWRYLAENPERRAELLRDDASLRRGLEELLRVFTTVNITRTVAHDATWHGVEMHEGDVVLLGLTAANRSMHGSGCPAHVDLQREENSHLAFGLRHHRCIGMHLGRRELEIAVREWHDRFPDYSLAGPAGAYHGGGVFGIDELSIELRAAASDD